MLEKIHCERAECLSRYEAFPEITQPVPVAQQLPDLHQLLLPLQQHSYSFHMKGYLFMFPTILLKSNLFKTVLYIDVSLFIVCCASLHVIFARLNMHVIILYTAMHGHLSMVVPT